MKQTFLRIYIWFSYLVLFQTVPLENSTKHKGKGLKIMLTRRITILFVCLALSILAAVVVFSVQAKLPEKPEEIQVGDYSFTIKFSESKIEQMMDENHLPSVAVVLIDDQDIIWQETLGFANLEAKIPADSDTVYKLWSLAKVFTAIETMRLVDEGLADLDAPITDYLPDFSIQSRFPKTETITIRKILSHRSGLPRNECHRIEFGPVMLAELVDSLEDCHLAYPVGQHYKYSNIGFDLLGYLVEKIRDESFPNYMRDNLLLPVGMSNSAFLRSHIPDDSEDAFGYKYYEGAYYPYEQSDIKSLPSGNLYASADDMGKFVKFIFNKGKANGKQIINPDLFDEMFATQDSNENDPQPMGLGWKTANVLGSEYLVWHDGGPGEGIGGIVAMLPERKLGIVLISNSTAFESSLTIQPIIDILEIMLETKYGISTSLDSTTEKVDMDPTKLDQYTGKYVAYGEVMEIFLRGDQLKASIAGFSFDLDPINESTFQPRHWLADLGLADLLGIPIDLRQMKIEFFTTEHVMIIQIGDINYEICPKYPDEMTAALQRESLIGEYDLVFRLPSGRISDDILGQSSIQIEDGILTMAGYVGPLLFISESEIIILSGPFHGETMRFEPETGNIYHQSIVYKPKLIE
jgi:CubicO group peptidase (beta-lactamase class C family)